MSPSKDSLICFCYQVTRTEILNWIFREGVDEVGDVTWFTGAGGGCGGCRNQIQELIDGCRKGTIKPPRGRKKEGPALPSRRGAT